MTLSTTLKASVAFVQTTVQDAGNPAFRGTFEFLKSLANGTGASQADLVFSDERTLAASATENLDLAGVLTDAFGAVLTFAKVKLLYFEADAANTNSVIIGAAASNPFLGPLGGTSPTITLPPGGACLLAAPVNGWAVTASTADLIKVANSGGSTSVKYKTAIVGTSA